MKKRMHNLVILGILISISTSMIPNAYGLTSTEQYNFGFLEGGQRAATDIHIYKPFNSACGHATDGKHTSYYCAGWVKGYTTKWDYLVRHGAFWAQQRVGSGLCGGDYRRIRIQVQSKNGTFVPLMGMIDSGTPIALMNPRVVSSLGFANNDAYRTITGLGNVGTVIGPVIKMNVKFDPNPEPLQIDVASIDDGQGTVFTPMPITAITMRVNVSLGPNDTILTDVSNPQNTVKYDCMTNAITKMISDYVGLGIIVPGLNLKF